jgi:small subunit ribosomal protein S8e
MTEKPTEEVKLSNSVTRKIAERKQDSKLDPECVPSWPLPSATRHKTGTDRPPFFAPPSSLFNSFAKQFATGKVLAMLSSRPGQSGRADGYILEGAEFHFYLRKIMAGKNSKA